MPKPKDMPKIDLTLLKKLVTELELSLTTAEGVNSKTDVNEHIIELAKASGLAAGIMQEAQMLVGDVYAAIRLSQGPATTSKNSLLDSILGPLKGDGSAN